MEEISILSFPPDEIAQSLLANNSKDESNKRQIPKKTPTTLSPESMSTWSQVRLSIVGRAEEEGEVLAVALLRGCRSQQQDLRFEMERVYWLAKYLPHGKCVSKNVCNDVWQ